MFSDRFNWDLSPNALSLILLDKKSRGEPILDLTQSNPTQAGLEYKADDILAALAQAETMTYEPDPRGLLKARRAIARYYLELGEPIHSEAVFLTASTSEAYSMIFKLLGNPGDEILIPRPGYPLISYLARFESLQPFSYPLRYNEVAGWSIDLDVLQALITPRCRAIVVVNPNNPTGNYLKRQELADLDQICRHHHLALIVDEVFSDYHGAEGLPEVPTVANRAQALTFVLNGFSKMLGLPQVKLGWVVLGGDPGLSKAAQDRLEILLDFYLSVSTPVQHAAAKLLGHRPEIQRQILARIAANSRILAEQISRTSNCRALVREGGWYAVVEIFDAISEENRILQLLEHEHTLVHPGHFYGFDKDGIVVVSLLPPVETFHAGISRLISQ
ncbi:MAG: pyridoxal phosphate-dependent aminotransferase [Desulfobacterales bacterium]|nr:MAG: pyridoxal phosphate-dependent aminotransferase [Desulfobacterales bacterium]